MAATSASFKPSCTSNMAQYSGNPLPYRDPIKSISTHTRSHLGNSFPTPKSARKISIHLLKNPFLNSSISFKPRERLIKLSESDLSPPRRSHHLEVGAKLVEFNSRKTVSIEECLESGISVEEYLADTQRIVDVTFPDSKRLKYLGGQTWQARLKPVSFFTISATPVCKIRTWFESNELRIFSDDVILLLDGLPPQFHDVKLHLHLHGKLYANRNEGRRKRNINMDGNRNSCTLDGWVDLNLKFNLPMPFSLLPGDAISAVGSSILDSILSTMQRALLNGLIQDYSKWSEERMLLKSRQQGQVQSFASSSPSSSSSSSPLAAAAANGKAVIAIAVEAKE